MVNRLSIGIFSRRRSQPLRAVSATGLHCKGSPKRSVFPWTPECFILGASMSSLQTTLTPDPEKSTNTTRDKNNEKRLFLCALQLFLCALQMHSNSNSCGLVSVQSRTRQQ